MVSRTADVSDPHPQLARREQVQSLPRPEQIAGVDSKEIQERVRKVKEIANTWRAYSKDWLFIKRFPTQADAMEFFKKNKEGRVTEDDWRIRHDEANDTHVLELRLWNILCEFKTEVLVQEFVADLNGNVEIVERNSRAEHLLMDYGSKLTEQELGRREAAKSGAPT